MPRFNAPTYRDRFATPYDIGAKVVYPVRRGSSMELVTAYVVEHTEQYVGGAGYRAALRVRRHDSDAIVLLRNLKDVVVVDRVPVGVSA